MEVPVVTAGAELLLTVAAGKAGEEPGRPLGFRGTFVKGALRHLPILSGLWGDQCCRGLGTLRCVSLA